MFDANGHVLHALQMTDVETPAGADLAMSMPVTPHVTNPRGGMQGGLVATLVDVVAGRAALARLGEGRSAPTADLQIRYLSPITVGPAKAVATVLRAGRISVVVLVEVFDEGRDALAAVATLSFTILARPAVEAVA